jgi:hypothetical protein
MFDWHHLTRLPDRELARVDIALTNLACAAGLRGSERIDIGLCLRTLDAWAEQMGYPLMLAMTRCHQYVRWDALPWGECFNIEASGDGVSFFPDDHYRTGRFEMPPGTIRVCGYLQSLSPREEVASFLVQRGECWMQEQVYGEALTAFAWANELDPRRQQHALLTLQAMKKWDEQLRAKLPPRHFPKLDIGLPPPQFRQIPREVEREIIRLRVMEGLLKVGMPDTSKVNCGGTSALP